MNDYIHQLQHDVAKAKQKLSDAIAALPADPVEDWRLSRLDGTGVNLSELFGEKTELLVIHNMGRGCPYCSLWGDAMIGIAKHLQQRCSFVLCSNDPPEIIEEFRELRGWDFPCVSGYGSGFALAMGYTDENGKPLPGVSAFHKQADGSLVRTGHSSFGPGDGFCGVWPMLDLIHGGKGDWEPSPDEVESCCRGGSGSSCKC